MSAAGGEELRAYRDALVRFCLGYVNSAEDAEDAVQDTLVKAASASVRPDNLRAWLYKVARNHCLNQRRARGRRRDAAPLPAGQAAAGTWAGELTRLVRAEQRSRVAHLVAALPEGAREVLRLRYIEGLSRAEVAEVLDLPESVVKSRIYEALRKLREHTSLVE